MSKFFIGPMSKEIVDCILKRNHEIFSFIPSRRQIDFNSGYVNNWTTKTFTDYVKSINKNFLICRDHGGPLQGYASDNGFESLSFDSNHFDIIHIDPWKFTKNIDIGITLTYEYINHCLKINKNLKFEIGTEEAIFPLDNNNLKYFVDQIYNLLKNNFDSIDYIVLQSGTKLKGFQQIGNYDKNKLVDQIKIIKKFDKKTKEHNGDYIDESVIKEKFNLGLDAINIAPEFGYLQTCSILEYASEEQTELMFDLCYKSNRWKNWVDENFIPQENKIDLIKICGHYIFNDNKFKETNILNSYENEIKKTINNKLDLLTGSL